MLAVSNDKLSIEAFQDLLDNPSIGRAQFKAPPGGLYKLRTKYEKSVWKTRKIIK